MTSDSQSPGEPPKQINLQQIAQQFMVGLQRHFDMLAYTLASRQAVSEADYKHIARAPQMMPVPRAIKISSRCRPMRAI